MDHGQRQSHLFRGIACGQFRAASLFPGNPVPVAGGLNAFSALGISGSLIARQHIFDCMFLAHAQMRVGTARRREAAAIAWRIVGLLGLTEAAEPLPRRLLVLLERQSR